MTSWNRLDLTGYRFGRLRVIREMDKTKWGNVKWFCQCACGNEITVAAGRLRRGHTTSCGCWQREATASANKTHGGTTAGFTKPEYRAWVKMRDRCNNPTDKGYRYYGGRGIRVCARWNSYAAFAKDMGPKPSSKHSLDRIDNNGNYEPSNCRWATRIQQIRNRSNTVMVTHDGQCRPLAEWCELLGLPYERTRAHFQETGIVPWARGTA